MGALQRSRIVELSTAECLLHLREGQYGVGRVGLAGPPPSVLPVNYLLDDSTVVVRTASSGLLAAADAGEWVAFEIDHTDDGGDGTVELWGVLLKGPAEWVVGHDETAYLRLTRLEPAAGGFRPTFVRIHIGELTGRARP